MSSFLLQKHRSSPSPSDDNSEKQLLVIYFYVIRVFIHDVVEHKENIYPSSCVKGVLPVPRLWFDKHFVERHVGGQIQ